VRLEGRICLVTGASSGIGRATAFALASAGAHVIASDRLEAALDDVVEVTGGRRLGCDLSRPGAGSRLAAEALSRWGRVDVLVNCAGVGLYGRVDEGAAGDSELVLAVNVIAPIELTRSLLPGMVERGSGHVVNVGSVVGHVGRPYEAVYAASKAAMAVFTESLRAELRTSGVGASLVSPAAVDTRFFAARGVPYGRRWPRPVGAERIAAAIVASIRNDRAEVFVPRWLAFAVRVHGAVPRAFRVVASRLD
jgi:short-subunit dehydrogenase